MSRKKVRFIANPLSGANRQRDISTMLNEHFDDEVYDYELCYTEHAGHAISLAREAVEQGHYMVVACGGDGSVNEIASQLIDTDAVLGVLPCGSGNGFAMHLGLGRNVKKAIGMLNDGRVISIDTCRMNNRPFVNLSGIGFDAVVARRLNRSRIRGMLGYLRYTIEETIRYRMQSLEIQIDGNKMQRTCLLVEVANAPIYGYGFSIVPTAKPNDGKLEVLIARAASKWRYLFESWRFLTGSFHKSSLVECYKCDEVVIRPDVSSCAVHVDGEGFALHGEARYTILPDSLKVMCPKAYAEILA